MVADRRTIDEKGFDAQFLFDWGKGSLFDCNQGMNKFKVRIYKRVGHEIVVQICSFFN